MSNGDIEVLLRSRVPLIVIESRDESRVLRHLQLACRNATPLVSAARSDFGEVGRPSLGVPLFFVLNQNRFVVANFVENSQLIGRQRAAGFDQIDNRIGHAQGNHNFAAAG